jgi:hypothetical protein
MTDRKTLQYELAGGQSVFKAFAHTYGRTNRPWAGCQFFHFEPEGKKCFLLTSPFMEPAPVASTLQTRIERRFDQSLQFSFDFTITPAVAVILERSFISFRELYPDLLHRYALFQLFCPVQDDVDFVRGCGCGWGRLW